MRKKPAWYITQDECTKKFKGYIDKYPGMEWILYEIHMVGIDRGLSIAYEVDEK